MILDKDKRKLGAAEDYYKSDNPFSWVAHPAGEDGYKPDESFLIANRDKIEVIGGVVDEDADYSYDETAFIKLKGKYYLLQTSGCSCPSPTETWRIVFGPTTPRKIKKQVIDGNYGGYTYNHRELQELLAVIDSVLPVSH